MKYDDDRESKELGSTVFGQLDSDGSGYLSGLELELAKAVILRPSRNAAARALLSNMEGPSDLDGDGRVDPEEWHKFIGSLYDLLGRKVFLVVTRGWSSDLQSLHSPGRVEATAPAAAASVAPPVSQPEAAPTAQKQGSAPSAPQLPPPPVEKLGVGIDRLDVALRERAAMKIQKAHRMRAERQGGGNSVGIGRDVGVKRPPEQHDELDTTRASSLSTTLAMSGSVLADSGAADEQPAKPKADSAVADEQPAKPKAESTAAEAQPTKPKAESAAAAEQPAKPKADRAVADEKPAKPKADADEQPVKAKEEVEPPLTEQERAQRQAAATKIQKLHRGRVARGLGKAAQGLTTPAGAAASASLRKAPAAAAAAAPKRDQQEPSTVADLWELLTIIEGRVIRFLDVADFMQMWQEAVVSGLTCELRDVVPMKCPASGEREEVSRNEVGHLCAALKENLDLSLEDARLEISLVKDICRNDAGRGAPSVPAEQAISYRQFRRLLSILSELMQLDTEYIVSHLFWVKVRRFELTDTMAALLVEKGMPGRSQKAKTLCRKGEGFDAQDDEMKASDEKAALMTEPIQLDDMMVLCRSGGLVDVQKKTGISAEDIQHFFVGLDRKMPELLKTHAQLRRKPLPELPPREKGVTGRNEFEIMLSQLWKQAPLFTIYRSPLQMAMRMLQNATKQPFSGE